MPYQDQILGTIIASVLNYDELCQSIGEQAALNPARSTYAPCDGRSVAGSALAKITQRTTLPDLRGKFLRGLNLMYSVGQPLPFDASNYGDTQNNRTVGDYQFDEFKSHNHVITVTYPASQPGRFTNGGGAGNGGTEVTSFSGGEESRPRNIAVYYYIKIN